MDASLSSSNVENPPDGQVATVIHALAAHSMDRDPTPRGVFERWGDTRFFIYAVANNYPAGHFFARYTNRGKSGLSNTRYQHVQPGSIVATCHWIADESTQAIRAFTLYTRARSEHGFMQDPRSWRNRITDQLWAIGRGRHSGNQPEDVRWAREQLAWLWAVAGLPDPLPEIVTIHKDGDFPPEAIQLPSQVAATTEHSVDYLIYALAQSFLKQGRNPLGPAWQRYKLRRDILAAGDSAVTPVLRLAQHPDHLVRAAGIDLLGQLHDVRASPVLFSILINDFQLIHEARRALGRLPRDPCRLAIAAIPDSYAALLFNLLQSLNLTPWEQAEDESPVYRAIWKGILIFIGPPAIPSLLDSLTHAPAWLPPESLQQIPNHTWGRMDQTVLDILGMIKDAQAVGPLQEYMVQHNSPEAARALRRIGTPAALEAVAAWEQTRGRR